MTSCCRRWACRAAALALLAGPGCSGGDTVGCGEVERLRESRADTHVVDVDVARYDHHPPSSGPHFSGRSPEPGVHDAPVPEAKQITALELGFVVIQYDEDAAADADALDALAEGRDDVIVAPAATPIDGDRHVAFTAWTLRQRCDGVSDAVIDDAEAFVADHAGRVPHG